MMKRNRKDVLEFVKKVKTPLKDALLLEHADISLAVYQGKTRKKILLLSSLYLTVDIGTNHPKKLPETISFYYSTKFGVDQMARNYSVKRRDQGGGQFMHSTIFLILQGIIHGFYTKKLPVKILQENIFNHSHCSVA
ncbi:hypothetical protein TNCV_4431411 [Trichonephila clavipes]|nr:hypothetical protein TNCV_4431411 [Trichonephila clavipes]